MNAGLICARGGSKRIKSKNVCVCAGKKLIEWSLLALQAKCVDRIYVSTDDERMKQIARDYGARVIDRPWQLATDKASNSAVVYHAFSRIIDDCNPEYIATTYPTSPCIQSYMIDEALKTLQADTSALKIGTVYKKHKPSQLNNYQIMLPDKRLLKVFPETDQGVNAYITNNLVDLYYGNGGFSIERINADAYMFYPEIPNEMPWEEADFICRRPLQEYTNTLNREGRNIMLGYILTEYESVDINVPMDLVVAEAILNYRKHMSEVCGLEAK